MNSFQIVSLMYWKQYWTYDLSAWIVVNSFQIVSLMYWKQYISCVGFPYSCCEFLSNCIFDVLKTVGLWTISCSTWLWIPFKLYLWCIENSNVRNKIQSSVVVNSFQIVSLMYWKQSKALVKWVMCCCEFLSNCIFDVLKTVPLLSFASHRELWIPFKLYLWCIENSLHETLKNDTLVVNSFQIVSLMYWKQW